MYACVFVCERSWKAQVRNLVTTEEDNLCAIDSISLPCNNAQSNLNNKYTSIIHCWHIYEPNKSHCLSIIAYIGSRRRILRHMAPNLAWLRHQMDTFSALLAICAGNSLVTGEFPEQRPVTKSFYVFFDLRLNKRLSKQWWGWWFETPPRPLWHHCNVQQAHSHSQELCQQSTL